jgi:hypothetical protein
LLVLLALPKVHLHPWQIVLKNVLWTDYDPLSVMIAVAVPVVADRMKRRQSLTVVAVVGLWRPPSFVAGKLEAGQRGPFNIFNDALDKVGRKG